MNANFHIADLFTAASYDNFFPACVDRGTVWGKDDRSGPSSDLL